LEDRVFLPVKGTSTLDQLRPRQVLDFGAQANSSSLACLLSLLLLLVLGAAILSNPKQSDHSSLLHPKMERVHSADAMFGTTSCLQDEVFLLADDRLRSRLEEIFEIRLRFFVLVGALLQSLSFHACGLHLYPPPTATVILLSSSPNSLLDFLSVCVPVSIQTSTVVRSPAKESEAITAH
jgi:hypothetical protein